MTRSSGRSWWIGTTVVSTFVVIFVGTFLLTGQLEFATLVALGPFAGEHLADFQGCAEHSRQHLKGVVIAVVLVAALALGFLGRRRRASSGTVEVVVLVLACVAWFGSAMLSYLMVLG